MDEEESADVDPTYTQHFKSHLDQTVDHLNGISHIEESLSSSFYPPCGYWTAAEKDLFFHGLCVYSRLRPDLIAADITTKTVVDVCTYLNLVTRAAAENEYRLTRRTFDAAVEVSDAWVQFEEEQAAALSANEPIWEDAHLMAEREAVLKAERDAIKGPRRKRGLGRDREEERENLERFNEMRVAVEAKWAREDFMRELSSTHLEVFDNVLREAEDPAVSQLSNPSFASHTQIMSTDPTCNGISENLIDPILLAISQPDNVGSTQTSRSPSAPSLPAPNADVNSACSSFPKASTPSLSGAHPLGTSLSLPKLPSVIPTFLSPTTHPYLETPDPAQPLHGLNPPSPRPSADPEDNLDLSALSPRTRRRHQKRLYMRRKRAQLNGGVVSAEVARLKPGRKTNKKLERALARKALATPSNASRSVSAQAQEAATPTDLDLEHAKYTISPDEEKGVVEVGGEEEILVDPLAGDASRDMDMDFSTAGNNNENTGNAPHPHVGGTTLPYKIKARFIELGMDASSLYADGLGLFHLSRLGKMMTYVFPWSVYGPALT